MVRLEVVVKHKVSELEGALLDAAVAKAEGRQFQVLSGTCYVNYFDYCPSLEWELAGEIIERERISLMYIGARGWSANFEQWFDEGEQEDRHTGPTPLIAAMRAYVSAKLGDEVELP
jgi:hypothetical protein